MSKKIVSGLFVLMLMFSAATAPVFACQTGGGHGMRGKHGHDSLESKFFYKAHSLMKTKEELQLSEEQLKTIQDLKAEAKKNLIRSKAEIDVIEIDLASQIHADKMDSEAALKLIDQKYELKKESEKNFLTAYAKLKGAISEKQWETFRALKKECGKKHSEEAAKSSQVPA